MLKIGITGGIGSGKSTVCKIFEQLGIPVYSADLRARELMHTDTALVSGLKAAFGDGIYDAAGHLQRAVLAGMVFNAPEKLALLNSLVHPAVFRDYAAWAASQPSPYVMKEAALMFESGSYKDQDYVINVSAPKEIRIARVMTRDGVERKAVLARMRNQLSEKERRDRSDFIIRNDGLRPLIPQVLQLHRKFLDAAQPL